MSLTTAKHSQFIYLDNGHTIKLVGRHEVPSDLSWLHVDKETRGNRNVYAIHEDTGMDKLKRALLPIKVKMIGIKDLIFVYVLEQIFGLSFILIDCCS